MTVPTKTPDIAAVVAMDIGKGTGAPARQPGAHQAANPVTLTCTWVRTGDGALVMQRTAQTPEDAHEMTKAAA
jgi:hypothetical protein